MGILAVHITTVKIRDTKGNQVVLGYLGHPGQIGGWWVPQNDVTMEAVRADDYFPLPPVDTQRITNRRTTELQTSCDPHSIISAQLSHHGFVA